MSESPFKPYGKGRFYIRHTNVFYAVELNKLHIWTYHNKGMFKSTWELDREFKIATNVTPIDELEKLRYYSKSPSTALRVHYATVRKLGLTPVNRNGQGLFVGKCLMIGKCAFKHKRGRVALCTWPYSCNQKRQL